MVGTGPPGSPTGGPYCNRSQDGQDACYSTESERAAAWSASASRETAPQEPNGESPQQRFWREDQERREREAKDWAAAQDERERLWRAEAEAKKRRQDVADVRAIEKEYALPAMSAHICDLARGPNQEWVGVWKELLRERFKTKPIPCAQLMAILACADKAGPCSEDVQAVVDVWKLAEPSLWGGGPRSMAPLRCCDGSDSLSCVCGGSRSGCCSHHRGVCGCSRR